MKVLLLSTQTESQKSALWQIHLVYCPKLIMQSIILKETLTLSLMTGTSYHSAIDGTQFTILRDRSYGPSTVLKHTMFSGELRSMKHYNTVKEPYRNCLLSDWDQVRQQSGVVFTHQYPVCIMIHHSQSGFCPPAAKMKRSWYNIQAAVRHAEQLIDTWPSYFFEKKKIMVLILFIFYFQITGLFHCWTCLHQSLWDEVTDSPVPHHYPRSSKLESPPRG